jgi:probable F420-dependent oxidoreductase
VKIRIGIGSGASAPDGPALDALCEAIVASRFDSLWVSEVLTGPGLDPFLALAWAGARHPTLKLGTTMLLPGRNLVRLARQVAQLDHLTNGRFLLTFVPGLSSAPERDAIGVGIRRGAVMDDAMGILRRLWAGEEVDYDGPAGRLVGARVTVAPMQQPFDMWLGGMAHASLVRCGRVADGWLPSLCTPEDARKGREVIDAAAEEAGRTISPEHFGVSIGYARRALDPETIEGIARRANGRPVRDLVPVGPAQLRECLEAFIEVGFSKFVLRPLVAPASWPDELDQLARDVGDLQT